MLVQPVAPWATRYMHDVWWLVSYAMWLSSCVMASEERLHVEEGFEKPQLVAAMLRVEVRGAQQTVLSRQLVETVNRRQ